MSEQKNNVSQQEKEKAEELPRTAAFHDEDTKGYLKSTKETEPGYYTLESKTGGYSMLFPKEAVINPTFGEYHPDYFEKLYFGETNEQKNYTYSFDTIYEDKHSNKYINATLSSLSDSSGFRGDYKKTEIEGYMYYTGEYTETLEGVDVLFLVAYIKSQNTDQGIQIIYALRKNKQNDQTELDIVAHKRIFKKVVDSLVFKEVKAK